MTALLAAIAIRPLALSDLPQAEQVLCATLPYDRCSLVAKEKLFGPNHGRTGYAVGAFSPSQDLLAVLALAGRWVKVLAVLPKFQRRGLGTALLGWAKETLKKNGGGSLRIGDHPGNYLSPGVDERYLGAHAFFLARGLVRRATVLNLRVPFSDNPLVSQARLDELSFRAQKAGYLLRRAGTLDAEPLKKLIGRHFAPVWSFEVARACGPALGAEAAALTHELPEGPAVHIAIDAHGAAGGDIVAFAVHDGNNRGLGWFGPMGTLATHRGRGLGEALLLACLLDVQHRPEGGVIAWIGPQAFYERVAGALPDRRFTVFEEP